MAEINLSGPPHHSLGRYFLGLLLGLLHTDLDISNLEKSRMISAEDGTILCLLTCLRPYVMEETSQSIHRITFVRRKMESSTGKLPGESTFLPSSSMPGPAQRWRKGMVLAYEMGEDNRNQFPFLCVSFYPLPPRRQDERKQATLR